MEILAQILDIKDVAAWFLNKNPAPHKKLQKLCYYAVAWHYTLFDAPLCTRDEFQAWVHGPVNTVLYNQYKGTGWQPIHPNGEVDFGDKEEFMEMIWLTYGDLSGVQLEILTHEEEPWIKARNGLGIYESSENIISIDEMKKYYAKEYENSQNE
ncbi:hypothetical protein MsAg5_01060 [Methanosarcinaceae archaeon Ag5]|uniref:Antitoxin SocA-like Panacea domain-containing protein n=1 Tax=Methanolapillus africanus TaxID=3028297 RepID=A0AAE4MGP4_9EURY|nr:hypothetical protein [Methanosarcinaceae archaeon Ag5]